MILAAIGLGSNLDSPIGKLRSASTGLESLRETTLDARSRIYRSAAVGPGPQDDYLNGVITLRTRLEPEALLEALQTLETAAGRERRERWGPRTLDLDLLLYGEHSINTPLLTVPHPRLFERNFVLRPLADIFPPNWHFPDGSKLGDRLLACGNNPLAVTGLAWSAPESMAGVLS